jgi:hypothetical protein
VPDVAAYALSVLRPIARERMRATCTIDRPGVVVTAPDGEVTCPATRIYPAPTWGSSHPDYRGPCYFRYPGMAFEQTPQAGGQVFTLSRGVVKVPFGVAFMTGDVVTVVSDPDNAAMVGKVLRVGSVGDQSQATAQRLLCDEYQGPPVVVGGGA